MALASAVGNAPPALPIYGNPEAVVPTIHIKDLANIALHVLEGHAEYVCFMMERG